MVFVTDRSKEKKFKSYSHSPFEFEWEGVKASVEENGKITITQETTEEGEVLVDEIRTSAAFILRLTKMLEATKKVHVSDEPYKKKG